MQSAKRDAVKAQALQATTIIRASIREAAPSGKLTPRRVNVGAGFKEGGTDAAPYAIIRPRGPIGLIENGVKPHVIRPKALSKRRVRAGEVGKRALASGSFGPVAAVRHPGTKGKHPWAKGVDEALRVGGTKMITVVSDRALKVWTR